MIQRFEIQQDADEAAEESEFGPWVRFQDHQRVLKETEEEGVLAVLTTRERLGEAEAALQEINEYDVSPEVQKILNVALLGTSPIEGDED